MSAGDTLAAILAETKRREKILDELVKVAHDVVKTLHKEAKRRGVKGMDWMEGGVLDNMVFFDGKKGRVKKLAIFLHSDGSIRFDQTESKANRTYQGYPDLSDSAPALFERMAVETLLARLNKFCDGDQT